MMVTAPSDRHFRRKRVKPGRRASLRPRWKALAAVATAIALALSLAWLLARAATSSSSVQVERIIVKGAGRIAGGEIDARLAGLRGASLVTLDIGGWRDRLLELDWVDDAAVSRVFPDAVSVVVSERVAAGIGRIDDVPYLIDVSGVVIDEYGPAYANFELPLVNGLSPAVPGTEETSDVRVALAARLFAALKRRPDLARAIVEIDFSDPSDVVIVLKGDTAFVHIGREQFIERLDRYREFAETLREEMPDIDYVDVRYGDDIIAKPRQERASPRTPRGKAG